MNAAAQQRHLTDLAVVAHRAGLKVVEVDGWRSAGHQAFHGVQTVVCHHTAGPRSGNYPSLGVVRNGRAGLPGPLCNYGLGRDGTVYVVAAGVAWHAGVVRDASYGNTHAIGIEAENTGLGNDQPWPAVQMDAYARLCRAICDHYGLGYGRVLGHKEVCAPRGRKSDPSFDMNHLRELVARASTHQEEDDMTPDQAKQLTEVRDTVKLTADTVGKLTSIVADITKQLEHLERVEHDRNDNAKVERAKIGEGVGVDLGGQTQ